MTDISVHNKNAPSSKTSTLIRLNVIDYKILHHRDAKTSLNINHTEFSERTMDLIVQYNSRAVKVLSSYINNTILCNSSSDAFNTKRSSLRINENFNLQFCGCRPDETCY